MEARLEENLDIWRTLSRLVANRNSTDAVFLNQIKQPLTRFGIHRLVTQYGVLASQTVPSLATKRVSPHTIRHTTAVHLLRAGVDINTLARGSFYVTRPTLMTYTAARKDLEAAAKELFEVVKSGKVKIEINQTFKLADAAQAHRDLEARKTTGSTVLLP